MRKEGKDTGGLYAPKLKWNSGCREAGSQEEEFSLDCTQTVLIVQKVSI